MKNNQQLGRRQQAGEFLNRFAVPGSKHETVLIPGFDDGPRSLLTFILKALDGKHEEMVADHLAHFLAHDFKFRPLPQGSLPLGLLIRDDPELFYRSVYSFTGTLRSMADMWIDSGKSPLDRSVDTPADRNVEDVQPGYEISLFVWIDRLLFDRHPRYTQMRRDGSIEIKNSYPHLDYLTNWLNGPAAILEEYGQMWAAWHFMRILDSSYSHQIARCDFCHAYFAYERTRLRTAKKGVSCPACKGKASVTRTKDSRNNAKAPLIETAAQKWVEWGEKPRRLPQKQWVACEVNKRHGTRYSTVFTTRWVSQNLNKLLERVETLRNAKG